jgi:hypothetical protein
MALAGWKYRSAVVIDNTASTSNLSYSQQSITISGSLYAAWAAHGAADGSDIRVTDSDGVTLLPYWREGIDSANSKLYLMTKVPFIGAGATKTIYVYWGKVGATDVSSPTATVQPANAVVGPTDVWTQSDTPNYNAYTACCCLKNQTGANASRNGYILAIHMVGGATNGGNDAKLGLSLSTDGGVTHTNSIILTPVAGSAAQPFGITELSNGTLLLTYQIGTNAQNTAAACPDYIAKSTDGGQTWSNLTTRTQPVVVPTGAVKWKGWERIWEKTPGGDLLWYIYYQLSGDTGWRNAILKCTAGNDPTNGSNWGNGTPYGNVPYVAGKYYAELALCQTTDSNHWIGIMRDATASGIGDGMYTASTDGGVTWTTPARMYFPGAAANANEISNPYLLKLISGNILLVHGSRGLYSNWGTATRLSTDNGVTFGNYPSIQDFMIDKLVDSQEYGQPQCCQRADGKVVIYDFHSMGTVNLVNVRRCIVDEDILTNQNNRYLDCQSFTPEWVSTTAGATISTAQHHNGSSSIRIDNNNAAPGLAKASLWPNYRYVGAAMSYALSWWAYHQVITQAGNAEILINPGGGSRSTVNTWSTPYTVKLNNAGSYVDSGQSITIGQWTKMAVHSVPTTPTTLGGSVLMNNAVISPMYQQAVATDVATGTQWSQWQGASTGSQYNNIYFIDDVAVIQPMATIPVVTPGAEQTISTGSVAPFIVMAGGRAI